MRATDVAGVGPASGNSYTRREAMRVMAGAPVMAVAMPANDAATPPASADPAWRELAAAVGERLIAVRSPLADCAARAGSGADALFASLKNPYALGDDPGLTQTLGWVGAWTSRASTYAVAAESSADVASAVNFARRQRVRLVVRGGGHSYFGNSNAAGSLLVWTRRMDAIEIHDAFRPLGAPADSAPVAAVSIGAGAIWGRVYDAVAVRAGRYVQGGGCLTVGVAGFVCGGGFGSLSKAFGTGASNLLEAEVVTADGRVRTVSAHSDPDLFFALRGGGGGTFGVITRLTLRTDPLPATIGAVLFSLTAASDTAWRELVARMLAFYAQALFNPVWGEQLRFSPGRRLSVTMVFHGLSEPEAAALWQPFLDWIRARPSDYTFAGTPAVIAAPGRRFWDPDLLRSLPGLVLSDDRAGAPASNVFWASNRGEAAQVLHAYESAWMPAALLSPEQRPGLVDALVAASTRWSVTLHTNKGLAGGAPEAIARTRQTAMNPAVADAFALLISAAEGPPAWPGIPGHEPDVARARRDASAVHAAMGPIRALVPDSGAYVSEEDFFRENWPQAYWGVNYARLAAIKNRYDPAGLFSGHHTVGGT